MSQRGDNVHRALHKNTFCNEYTGHTSDVYISVQCKCASFHWMQEKLIFILRKCFCCTFVFAWSYTAKANIESDTPVHCFALRPNFFFCYFVWLWFDITPSGPFQYPLAVNIFSFIITSLRGVSWNVRPWGIVSFVCMVKAALFGRLSTYRICLWM